MANSIRINLRRGLLAATLLTGPLLLAMPECAHAQMVVGVSITIAPPVLPVYEQPPMPDMGYVWTPGYWAYGDAGYYWVPGTWVEPPEVGYLWTPPYWGWNNGFYVFNPGYWGPHVGFYGGVNYGYGYGGNGYDGGRWNGGHFEYNSAANNFGSVHVANAYRENLTVVNRSNVSYMGGAGGLRAAPTAQDRLAEHDNHIQAATSQERHISAAPERPAAEVNHDSNHAAIPAPSRPAEFGAAGNQRPEARPVERPAEQMARPVERPAEQMARPEASPERRPAQQMARPAAARPEEREAAPARRDDKPQKQ